MLPSRAIGIIVNYKFPNHKLDVNGLSSRIYYWEIQKYQSFWVGWVINFKHVGGDNHCWDAVLTTTTSICLVVKGIVHPKMKMLCLYAYPQGIQDVGDFVSSVEHKWRFLTQTVAVCQSYNGSQWDPRLWESKPCGSARWSREAKLSCSGLQVQVSYICKQTIVVFVFVYLVKH